MSSSCLRFLDHTQRRATFGRTPLDDWTSRLRDLYLTTHNTHNKQTSILSAGLEPTIWAGERPQTYALDRAATGTGYFEECLLQIFSGLLSFLLLCQYIERNIRNFFMWVSYPVPSCRQRAYTESVPDGCATEDVWTKEKAGNEWERQIQSGSPYFVLLS